MRITMILTVAAALAPAAVRDAIDWQQRARAAFSAGRYAEAEAGYRRALREFGAGGGLARALAAENLAVAVQSQGRLEEARPLLEEGWRELVEAAGAESDEARQAAGNLATLYWSVGEWGLAREAARNAGEPADAMRAVVYHTNLAAGALATGDLEAAGRQAQLAVELAQRALPLAHKWRAAALNNLAQVCRFTGRYAEAEAGYRAALGIWAETVGTRHPDYARGLMNLAALYHERGRDAGAEQLYRRAAEILEEAHDGLAAEARRELAGVLRCQGRVTEAARMAR